jgi:hypothetical protein
MPEGAERIQLDGLVGQEQARLAIAPPQASLVDDCSQREHFYK